MTGIINALVTVQPYRLEAIELMQSHTPTHENIFPAGLEPEQYAQATIQMIRYADTCHQLAQRIKECPAVPSEHPVEEFSL